MQRWNAIKSEKAKYNPSYPFLFPRPYEGLFEPVREVLRSQADNVNCQVGSKFKMLKFGNFTQGY